MPAALNLLILVPSWVVGTRGLEKETVPGPGTPSLALAFWEDTFENSVRALTAQTKQKSKWRRRREPARKDMLKA